MKRWRKIAVLVFVLGGTVAVSLLIRQGEPVSSSLAIAGRQHTTSNQVVVLEGSQPLEMTKLHRHLIERWEGELVPHPKDWNKGVPMTLALEFPNGEVYLLNLESYREIGDTKGVFRGRVEGEAFSEVVVSYVNSAVSGILRIPENEVGWEIRNGGEGRQIFEKVDLNELGECGVCRPRGISEGD